MVTEDQDALIVMEYVPGESLADIAARGAVRPEQAVRSCGASARRSTTRTLRTSSTAT